jgi:hypothetical protein
MTAPPSRARLVVDLLIVPLLCSFVAVTIAVTTEAWWEIPAAILFAGVGFAWALVSWRSYRTRSTRS